MCFQQLIFFVELCTLWDPVIVIASTDIMPYLLIIPPTMTT